MSDTVTSTLVGKLGDWVEADRVRSMAEGSVTLNQAVERIGDLGFLDQDDWGLVQLAWEDPVLFAYLYRSGRVSDFEGVGGANESWRLKALHRRAVERVAHLRSKWAGDFRQGCRLDMVAMGSRWARRINKEHFTLYTDFLLKEGKVTKEALSEARLLVEVAGAMDQPMGRRVSAAIETKYKAIFDERRIIRSLQDLNIPDGKEVDRERKALSRELVYFWQWAREYRPSELRQTALPGMTVEIPRLMGGDPVRTEVLKGSQLRKAAGAMGGEKKVHDFVTRLANIFADVSKAIARATEGGTGEPLEGLSRSVLTAFGFDVVGGRLQGRLARRWDVRVAETLLRGDVFPEENTPPLLELMEAVKHVGKHVIGAAGLVESRSMVWLTEGVGLKAPTTDKCRRVAAERLVLGLLARSGYEAAGFEAGGLAGVPNATRPGSVFREVMLDRVPKGDRQYWLDLEEKKGSCLVTGGMGEVRLSSLFDGLAGGFLDVVGFGDKVLGNFAISGFWDHPDEERVSPEDFWVLRDALLAAQVWAIAQIIGNGHKWLGLSPSYRRYLAASFRLASKLVEVQATGKYMVDGVDVLEGVDSKKRVAWLFSVFLEKDALFGGTEEEIEVLGVKFPLKTKVGDIEVPRSFVGPRSPESFLTRGPFVKNGEAWEFKENGGGLMLPGVEEVHMIRSLGQVGGMLVSGASRYRRAVLVAAAMDQKGGGLPDGLCPLVPSDMGDCGAYVSSVVATNGVGLDTLFWQTEGKQAAAFVSASVAIEGAMPADILPAYAANFTWGDLKKHWQTVGRRPSLAQMGLTTLSPLAYVNRVVHHLGQGTHPLTGEPLASGGGAPVETHAKIKKIWGMFYHSGQVPVMGEGVIANDLLKFWELRGK